MYLYCLMLKRFILSESKNKIEKIGPAVSRTLSNSCLLHFLNMMGPISVLLLVFLVVLLFIPNSPLSDLSILGSFKYYLVGLLVLVISFLLIAFQRNKVEKPQLVRESVRILGWKMKQNEGNCKKSPFAESASSLSRIAFAAIRNKEGLNISSELSNSGYEVYISSDVEKLLKSIECSPVDWSFLLLDLDLYSEINCAIEDLLNFRSICPDIAIVLLSSDVGRDDLSLERKVVADVTLRKPLSKSRLLNGLYVAHVNANFRLRQPSGRFDG